jgi:hypothetical protein
MRMWEFNPDKLPSPSETSTGDYTMTRGPPRFMASMRETTLLLVLAVAACGEPAQEPTASSDRIVTALSVHDLLVDCAGAIAAEGDVDPLWNPRPALAKKPRYGPFSPSWTRNQGSLVRRDVKRQRCQSPGGR